MKTGRTIQEIGAEIMRQSQAKEDYLVNTNSIVMEDWDGKPMLHLRGGDGLDLIEPLEIQQTAQRRMELLQRDPSAEHARHPFPIHFDPSIPAGFPFEKGKIKKSIDK